MLTVIKPGIEAIIEDYPGRLTYLGQGFAPSGAIDDVGLALGNMLVGNDKYEAAIEIAGGGFYCQFQDDAVIAITGTAFKPKVNGQEAPMWESFMVKAGDKLRLGTYGEVGFHGYVCVAGGIDVPVFLGSKSTCLFGNFGGFEGRPLKAEDQVKIGVPAAALASLVGRRIKSGMLPVYENVAHLRAIRGMSSYPEYITAEGMEYMFSTNHQLSVNVNRSALRLAPIGEEWFYARKNGGAGGSHPSNVVDHGYNTRGGVNVAGNVPSLLLSDSPTMGGYVCVLNVIWADMWKAGQVAPERDAVKFDLVTVDDAIQARKEHNAWLTMDAIVC